MRKKNLSIIAGLVASILLIPLIAMQFTEEVNWGLFDFIVAGILLTSLGIAFDLVRRKINPSWYRIIIWIILILIFLLIWAELGVGIFGTPFAGE